MVILDNRAMQLSSPVAVEVAAAAAMAASSTGNQYLNPDYLAPMPTEVSYQLKQMQYNRAVECTKCMQRT